MKNDLNKKTTKYKFQVSPAKAGQVSFRFQIVIIAAFLSAYTWLLIPAYQEGKHSVVSNIVGISYAYAETEEEELERLSRDTNPDTAEPARILPKCGASPDDIGSEFYDLNNFLWLLIFILRWIFSITGSLAVLMFVYGGYMWLISAGEEQRVKEGRTTMVNAVMGVAIILGSWLGVNVIVAALTGMPGSTKLANSIEWNKVGVGCSGRKKPIDFVKRAPAPPPPSIGSNTSGTTTSATSPAQMFPGQPQSNGPPPIANQPTSCYISVKESYEKWNSGIWGVGFFTGEGWKKDSTKNPNPAYSCRVAANKTWSECASYTSSQAGVPDKNEDPQNRTFYEFGVDKISCTSGGCPPINQITGKFESQQRNDCLRGERSNTLPGEAN